MNDLWLSSEQAETIARHALKEAPQEACGLLVGADFLCITEYTHYEYCR